HCPVRIEQMPLKSHPAPDEELAAIADAPELAADVPAREPYAPLSDAAEHGRNGRPDDRDVQERHEVIGISCGPWHDSPSGVRAEHTREGTRGPAQIALRGSERAHKQSIGLVMTAQHATAHRTT